MFEITYIHHDGFLLRTPELAMVFDFWYDPESADPDIPSFLGELPQDIPLYVLVSHFHKDHLNRKIFGWSALHPRIHFIISPDVERHVRYMLRPSAAYKGTRVDASLVTVISKPQSYSDDLVTVQAFGSTDVGNSYAVMVNKDNLKVFHAGDLNCWTWRDESTPAEVKEAEEAFMRELRPIAGAYPEFDVAMFPVDSRIGTGFSEGARLFLENVKVQRFFPMHFTLGDGKEEIERRRRDAVNFAAYAPGHGEFIGLTGPYDTYSDEDGVRPAGRHTDARREYSQEWFLSAGDCNAEQQLALPLLTAHLIDIATTHANYIGIGNPAMPNDHCGWVISRLAIEMESFPLVDSNYRIDTWVETWNRHFSERVFAISDLSGKPYGYARSIWMVLDTVTRANAGLDSLPFREEYLVRRPCPIARQGKHRLLMLPAEMDGTERRVVAASSSPARYTFTYSDLDAYRHVNTVKYVMLILNQFSLREHDEYAVSRLDLSFLSEGACGMTVEILRADSAADGTVEFMLRDAATRNPVVYARVARKRRRKPDAETPAASPDAPAGD